MRSHSWGRFGSQGQDEEFLSAGLHIYSFDERPFQDYGEILNGLQNSDKGVDSHVVSEECALFIHSGDGRTFC
ncbi:hypothetical protein I79_012680 [Cricetulus griseus]|uniref:Uncharacterized protein n=1 Tax=Cricetulus griseus TaxID=10029 RepID=G3HPG8_CRIGR|nr:hypothetical protein I79_012680 [Cricetulus griseus]